MKIGNCDFRGGFAKAFFLNDCSDVFSTIRLRLVPCLLAYSLAFVTIPLGIEKVMFMHKTLNMFIITIYMLIYLSRRAGAEYDKVCR